MESNVIPLSEEEIQLARKKQKYDKDEAKNIINKYPKKALKGVKLELDADWKKGMVAMFSMAMINIDISKRQLALSNQFSEAFDESLKYEKQIELNQSNMNELRITFRIKNLLLSSGEALKPEIIKMDAIIIRSKDEIYRDLFLYYVGAKAGLIGQLEESQKVGRDIDATLVKCFKEAIESGVNLEEIEKETLATINTVDDINTILATVYESVGINR